MTKWHYTFKEYQTFGHPITIALVGVGGTGTNLLHLLARMNHAMVNIGFAGIHVKAWDPDVITKTNPGRQVFFAQNIGMPKASTMISLVNRSFGLCWEAVDEKAGKEVADNNIVISCLDDWEWRLNFNKMLQVKWTQNHGMDTSRNQYWIDIGNEAYYGQIVLGSTKIDQPKGNETIIPVSQMMTVVDLAEQVTPDKISTNPGPSCSMAEALMRQDLFINNYMAVLCADMLWQLLSRYVIDYNTVYFNNSTKQITTKLYEKDDAPRDVPKQHGRKHPKGNG